MGTAIKQQGEVKIAAFIKSLLAEKEGEVDGWIKEHSRRSPPFFYSSVDIRHSGDKIVPVDTNLFPAGFHLLSEQGAARAASAVARYINNLGKDIHNVALLPEAHTRNLHYLDNVAALRDIITKAGYDVTLAGVAVEETLRLTSNNGSMLEVHPLKRDGLELYIKGARQDIAIVNNDLSSGAPDILRDLSIHVLPPVGMGWYRRRKTGHFDSYSEVVRLFAREFDFDPWLISTIFSRCGEIDFKQRKGLECVALNVERVLHKIRRKYDEYGIADEPYVFIKANSGTYGMGIMTAKSSDDVFAINKKIRGKMSAIKEGMQSTQVIIQEGVPTIDMVDGKPAEPMAYLVGEMVVGCTYRVNDVRDRYGNLNSEGMRFETVSAGNAHEEPDSHRAPCPVASLIARLASLAASRECYEDNWVI